ncbi:MAG: hypothetical protein JWM91_2913 [Rhodospirillales bacterium]|nr:hypothetical protein [Rhodospirillales bacterium]
MKGCGGVTRHVGVRLLRRHPKAAFSRLNDPFVLRLESFALVGRGTP